jgi:hypothetical protein
VLFFVASWLGRTTTAPNDLRNGMVAGQPTQVVSISSQSLFSEYESNEVATDLALKGKIVEVSGSVQSINKDVFDHMYVGLVTANQFEPAQMHVVSSEEAAIANLQKGQLATFRCANMKRWVGSPSGDDCILLRVR